MLLRIFSGGRASNAFIIFLFAGMLWLPGLTSPETDAFFFPTEAMPFFKSFIHVLSNKIALSKILAFALVLFNAFLLVRLNAAYILIQERTFLPAFFFLLLTGFYYPHLQFSEYIFGSISMIFILIAIFSTYKQEPNSRRFFDAGLMIGISVLFYARMVYFLPFIWIAQLILRPFSWREWITPILGMLTPAFLLVSIRFLIGYDPADAWVIFYDNLNSFYYSFHFTRAYIIISSYVFILVLMASGYMLKVFQFRKVYIRNYYLLFFWLFILSSVLFTFLTRFDPGMLYITAIPVSFILSNYFIHAKKSLGNRILFLLILLLFLANGLNHWFGWLE